MLEVFRELVLCVSLIVSTFLVLLGLGCRRPARMATPPRSGCLDQFSFPLLLASLRRGISRRRHLYTGPATRSGLAVADGQKTTPRPVRPGTQPSGGVPGL
jgi:hypothetical protein